MNAVIQVVRRARGLAWGFAVAVLLLGAGACRAASVSASSSAAAVTTPVVLYTDILSGPTTGGEGGNGIYLSIFGMNFGSVKTAVQVRIGGVDVASVLSLGQCKGRPDIQQITVQVGALGNPTPGEELPIQVLVNGVPSNSDHTFMRNPGDIYFVDNVGGNDSTGVVGDKNAPYRYVQTAQYGDAGVWGEHVKAGDFIVMRGTGIPWTDVGFDDDPVDHWGYFLYCRYKSGSAPTGASGTGPIVIMGYPGEDVYVRGELANGMKGGTFSGTNDNLQSEGNWIVITNLRIDSVGYDGPVSLNSHGDHWRVINNDLSSPRALRGEDPDSYEFPRMGGITGAGEDTEWLGNQIHHIQGSWDECHGFYIDKGRGPYEIAYNYVHDIIDGNGFQIFGYDVTGHVSFHHNWIHSVSKHGLNIAAAVPDITIHDNVVSDTDRAGVRFDAGELHNCRIYNNTFYNTARNANELYGALTNNGDLPPGALDIENNIFWPHPGTAYISGTVDISASDGVFTNNLWFGGTGSYSIDSHPFTGDPMFVSTLPDAEDFHLQAGSPAIDNGADVHGVVTNDYTVLVPRPVGLGYDIGAYEYEAADSVPPTRPTGLRLH